MNRIRTVGLFAYFHLISFLVFITRGSPYFVHKKLLLGTVLIVLSAAQSCSDENRGADAEPMQDASDGSNGGTGGIDSNRTRDASYIDSGTDTIYSNCYVPPMFDASDGRGGTGGMESNDSSTEDDGGSEFDDDSDAGSDD